ncbi:hypothetical protein [Peribacillus sp. Bi134]|uniref:hypothetical protein n=1 Tax=Peribacillus sp. Bi134 TaxID=2884272 RepID=UPI001D4CC020|nr:hypothetical protein [Peribacillus sp. Bi134]CAH0315949.1 hypothetical protein SRABI134_05308 [Peribacillus sp. Bi134]
MIESIEVSVFFGYYQGGGVAHTIPKIMTFSLKAYSCREIVKLVEEKIPLMWLAALQELDYRTINPILTQQMVKLLPKLFEEMIHQLIEEKHITMENYFLDRTIIEANASEAARENRKTYQQIQAIADEEDHELSNQDETATLTAEEKLVQVEKVIV